LLDGNTSTANKSPNGTASFKKDAGKPASATITVSTANAGPATNAASGGYYYHTKATLSVKPNQDATSGIRGVRIQVTGANASLGDKIYNTTGAKGIDITVEGDTTINAWTVDNAGNQSEAVRSVTIHLDNTAPVRPTLAITTTRSAYSTAADPWFNNAQVSVSITRGADYGGYQTGAYQIGYGTRTLGSTAKPSLTYTTGSTATVNVTAAGKTEVVAYTYDKAGKESSAGTITVQIDRTAPTIASLSCSPGDGAITMTANSPNDTGGAGIAQYVFFVNNNINGTNKTSTTASNSLPITAGYYLGCVVAIDKAGNVSGTSHFEISKMQGQSYGGTTCILELGRPLS